MNEKTKINFENCPLILFKINDSTSAAVLDLSQLLDLEKKSRFNELNPLASSFLLQKLLNTKEEMWINHEKSGRPILQNNSYFISKSHSHNMIAIALNKEKRIGCDIELIREKIVRVREKFLNKNEIHLIPKNNIETNILAWSIKESLLKANGNKSFQFKEKITISEICVENEKEFRSKAILEEETKKICSLNSWKIENYIFTCLNSIHSEDQ